MPDVCLQLRPGSRFKEYKHAFEMAERAGFDGVEIDSRALSHDHFKIEILSLEHGLPVKSVLAPGPVSFYLFDSEGDNDIIETLKPELIVLKTPVSFIGRWPLQKIFEDQIRHYKRTYGKELVAIENSCRKSIRQPLVDIKGVRDFAYAHDVLINFDVSDCAASGMDIILSCDMLVPKIKNVHFSDYGGFSRKGHLLPGMGLLPLGLLLGRLHEYRYNGLITIELDNTNSLTSDEDNVTLYSEIVGFIKSFF